MKIPIVYNARSVLQRPVSTALTALGIALVVAVFIGMLALANGFRAALARTGAAQNALLLRRGADSELSSGIGREAASIIAASPHVATGPVPGRNGIVSDGHSESDRNPLQGSTASHWSHCRRVCRTGADCRRWQP